MRWQVLKLDEDVKISLQYQNESGARVDVTSDGDLKVSEAESNSHCCIFVCLPLQCFSLVQSAGVGLNVLFADIIDEYVLVRL